MNGSSAPPVEWQLDPPDTLQVSLNDEPPPTREEIDGFLVQIRPGVNGSPVRVLVLDGELVRRRRWLTYPEVCFHILYEAARSRTATSAAPQPIPTASASIGGSTRTPGSEGATTRRARQEPGQLDDPDTATAQTTHESTTVAILKVAQLLSHPEGGRRTRFRR